jgi:hypothetical protein
MTFLFKFFLIPLFSSMKSTSLQGAKKIAALRSQQAPQSHAFGEAS